MTKKKIVAYYINDTEKEYILRYLDVSNETESFIIGSIDKSSEKLLEEYGIIFNDIRALTENSQNRDENFRIRGFFKFSDYYYYPVIRKYRRKRFIKSAYYLVRIYGPLLENYSEYLNKWKVEIIEFRSPDLYVVWIDAIEIFQQLETTDFIEEVFYISRFDTPLVFINRSKKETLDIWDKLNAKMLFFDVILHREEEVDGFISFLKSRNIAVAGFSGIKVRIHLPEHDPRILLIGNYVSVREIFEYIQPKLHNDLAKKVIGLEHVTVPVAFPYYGEDQLIGIADSGIDATHNDFNNRISEIKDFGGLASGTDQNGHGTHVAGTVLGDGSGSGGTYTGAAPKAQLYFQSLLNNADELTFPFDLKELFKDAYDKGVRIHNNSWGSSTNSRITAQAIEADQFVHEHRDMLLVFSAGNDGKSIDAINAPSGHVDLKSICSPATAKNILTVGSSRSSRGIWGYSQQMYSDIWPDKFDSIPYYGTETVSGNNNCLAAFSSRGPSDDDRIKPDIVAPGTDIVSAKSAQSSPSDFWAMHPNNNKYAIMGGTSMSAPIVTGCAALIREFYQKIYKHTPSAALLKATIINGVRKLHGTDATINHAGTPNFNQGFGMIDMQNTIPTTANNFFFHFEDNYLEPAKHIKTGKKFTIKIKLKSDGWIRVCMAYTDIPARALQNNLNLVVSSLSTNNKWIGNSDAHALLKGFDTKNNVETIIIDNALAQEYIIAVIGNNIIKGEQDFALIITASENTEIII
jgi:serine protease AprX